LEGQRKSALPMKKLGGQVTMKERGLLRESQSVTAKKRNHKRTRKSGRVGDRPYAEKTKLNGKRRLIRSQHMGGVKKPVSAKRCNKVRKKTRFGVGGKY